MANGLDIDYAPGAGPVVGRFVPPLELVGAAPVPELLRDGRAVLLDLADDEEIRDAASGHADRVRVVTAHRASHGAPVAVLVRPDGYVAWAGADPTGLPEALDGWFGAAHLPEGSVLH